ncbi:MAG: hypothetical protein KAR87_01070 [Candidatus Aenigmarchaeota archaeon]|nr:hypothetical protein [Candidatus Aenigmarchaeota archaeon]
MWSMFEADEDKNIKSRKKKEKKMKLEILLLIVLLIGIAYLAINMVEPNKTKSITTSILIVFFFVLFLIESHYFHVHSKHTKHLTKKDKFD